MNNPHAFPSSYEAPDGDGGTYEVSVPGMSLRDYFAGQALVGLVHAGFPMVGGHENIEQRAYRLADAMLKEREQE